MSLPCKKTGLKASFNTQSKDEKRKRSYVNHENHDKEELFQLVHKAIQKYKGNPKKRTVRALLALKLQSDNWLYDTEERAFIHGALHRDVFITVDEDKFF